MIFSTYTDDQAPVITCPPSYVYYIMNEAERTFNTNNRVATATDNQSPVTIIYDPPTHTISKAAVGTNIIINATATDPHGNQVHCQFMVQFEGKTMTSSF